MSGWDPRGLSRGNTVLGGAALMGVLTQSPWWGALIPASVPRIIGETAHAGGQLAGLAAKTGADYRPAAITATGVANRADEKNRREMLDALMQRSPYESIRN